MTEPPAGTATFLFSDIEGSTKLLRELGQERYEQALSDYQRVVREACAEDGYEIDTQGDAFFFAFARAKDAALAAAGCQGALLDGPLKARIGLHTGEARLSDGRYVGLSVHRAARVCSAAHGGQVVVSETTASVLEDEELGELTLRNVGRRSLKDFERPVTLYRLEGPGLAGHVRPPKDKRRSPRPSRRLLMGLAALVIAVAVAVPLALTGGSSSVKVGPTSLAVIDPKTNKVVDAIELGFKPRLIAAGEGHVWLIDPEASTLVSVDPRSRRIVRTGIASDIVASSIAAGSGSVWIVGSRHGRRHHVVTGLPEADLILLQIDPTTGVLNRSTVLGPSEPIYNLAGYVAAGDKSVWVLESETNRVSRVNPATGLRRVLAKGVAGATWGIAVGKGAVWTAGQNTVTRIDSRTGAVASTPPLPGVVPKYDTPSEIALGGGSVWFATTGSDSVWRVDPTSVQASGTAPVGTGSGGVAYGGGATWVAATDGTVTRVDAASGRTIATINLGQPLRGIVAAYGKVWVVPLT